MERLKIGSLVSLKQDGVKVLIIGHLMQVRDTYTDYAGVLYPYGIGSLEDIVYFNQDDIQTLIKEGYASDATRRYHQLLDHFEAQNPRKEKEGD